MEELVNEVGESTVNKPLPSPAAATTTASWQTFLGTDAVLSIPMVSFDTTNASKNSHLLAWHAAPTPTCTDAFARRCGLGSPRKCQPQRPGNTPCSSISSRLCVQRAPPKKKRSHTLAPERHVHMLAVCSMCRTLVSGALFRVMPTRGPCI